MKNLGLKYQILLIALLPVLLIDIVFTFNHITRSIDQENEMLRNKGHIIARQIAGASEFNLYTGNDRQIQILLDQTVGSDDIVLASVYDRRGELVAESASAEFRREDSPDYFYFREAILSQNLELPDVFEPDLDESLQPQPQGSVNLYISRQHLQQKTLQIFIESSVFFVALLVMAVLLTAVVSRRITGPVFRMVEHLHYVETGQLGKTIEATEANEIGALQAGFNRMTQALLANRRHLNHRIHQATQQLNEAITDLESKNRELGFARDLAEDANRSKSEFLANMSHEIRTPINGIKGFIGLLGQSSLKASQRRYVDIITKSTNDLTAIVDEILDFSKMESGKLHIVDEVFDLYEVIEQTRDLLFISVLTKSIDLNLIIFSDTPRWVIGDKLRLKQILLNLIGNAIKFTDQGRVVIRVSVDDLDEDQVSLLICVEDSGIGISEQDQQSLFQAFSQVESSATRRFTGTGLGLVISQNLAALMGGKITMRSIPGEGSKFSLLLPFKLEASSTPLVDPGNESISALIFASEQSDLMEVRTLFDRAGIITECELIDNSAGIEPLLQSIQRNRNYLDLLVFDLRQIKIDLDGLLNQEALGSLRVIVMHYDPGIRLPARSDHAEFVSIISTSSQIAQIVYRNTPDPAVLQTSNEAPSPARKKVLLVDDNQVNLKLASELIRLWGHQVLEAEHGEQALEIYRREKFDLVILDIQMPDIDGVSLLQMMRECNPDDTVPIVALTANVLNREANRLLNLGFDYFLGKPIDEVKFRSLLDGHPERRSIAEDRDCYTADAACSLDYARSLKLSADNESLLKQIFTILQHDIPLQRRQLSEAFAEQDYSRLQALAHKLQGVTCYVSLPRLRRILLAFQQQLDGEAGESLDRLNNQLEKELDAVAQEVEHHLQQLKDTPLPS
ncbi:ATP-binding protein [Gammaproteobacteria bacterium]|nr:ATP-binding protein [Gammaproteobacteria bacterium]